MKQTINFSDFHYAFHKMDRANNFSYDGLRALYDYLTELEDETGHEMELDVIALCCNYTEYNAEELQGAYGKDVDELRQEMFVLDTGDFSYIVEE